MFAIRNKRTGKWLYGTDFSYNDGKPRQRTSHERAMTWDDPKFLVNEWYRRKVGKEYEIVEVMLIPVELIPEAMKSVLSSK